MAAMGSVLGGVVGFWLAVLGKLVFGLDLLSCLGLWSLTGLTVLGLILLLPRPPAVPRRAGGRPPHALPRPLRA
jgi:hypothetical protein